MSNIHEQCLEIIRATNDGNDLSPSHLYLVQTAVNGWLSEAGEVAFAELYSSVKRGYQRPWHFAVENVTKDHEGYIYWRGQQIEHYSYQDPAAEKTATEEFARCCLALEAAGREVNFCNYIKWHDENRSTHAPAPLAA